MTGCGRTVDPGAGGSCTEFVVGLFGGVTAVNEYSDRLVCQREVVESAGCCRIWEGEVLVEEEGGRAVPADPGQVGG